MTRPAGGRPAPTGWPRSSGPSWGSRRGRPRRGPRWACARAASRPRAPLGPPAPHLAGGGVVVVGRNEYGRDDDLARVTDVLQDHLRPGVPETRERLGPVAEAAGLRVVDVVEGPVEPFRESPAELATSLEARTWSFTW